MQIRVRAIKTIPCGAQFALDCPLGSAIIDYFADSKKRTLYAQKVSDPAVAVLLDRHVAELKDGLDRSRTAWSRPEFIVELPSPKGADADTASGMLPGFETEKTQEGDSAGVLLFTDGGASPNPGAGACAWIIRRPGQTDQEGARYAPATTNNRMELQAVIEGLSRIPAQTPVRVHCDSTYVQQGISSWIHGWKKKGWKTAKGSDVLNRDLWEELDRLATGRNIRWLWVRGHAGHPDNERCDALVGQARLARQDIGP